MLLALWWFCIVRLVGRLGTWFCNAVWFLSGGSYGRQRIGPIDRAKPGVSGEGAWGRSRSCGRRVVCSRRIGVRTLCILCNRFIGCVLYDTELVQMVC